MDLPLHPTLPISPLEKWGIDYIDLIAPMSSRRNQYIIITVEYLTKWEEAKMIKVVDAKQIAIFSYKNIIFCFGCPQILVSDRGTYFLNEGIEEMTNLF